MFSNRGNHGEIASLRIVNEQLKHAITNPMR